MSNASQNASTGTKVSPPWSTDAVGVGAAVVCAMVMWGSAELTGLELAVEIGTDVRQIGGWAVALTAGSSALLGFVVLRLLERLTPRALAIWTVLATLVAVLSFLGPWSATTTAARGTLIGLHAVVAVVVIASAQASRRSRRARRWH